MLEVEASPGVVVDFADPTGNAVGTDGKPAAKKYKINGSADADGVRRLAKEAALRGDQAQAERLAGVLGENPPKVNFFERPVSRGDAAIALGTVAVTAGGAVLGVKLWRRHKLRKLAGGKVIKMAR